MIGAPAAAAATKNGAVADAKQKPKTHKQKQTQQQQQGGGGRPKKQKGGNKEKKVQSQEEIFGRLEIKVAQIVSAFAHPDADSLYVEQVDVGEDEPRQVVSGLRKYISLDEFKTSRCFVITNLKSGKMRGIESFGMVLGTSC
jgi:methionine--tRNA ligase beta chain